MKNPISIRFILAGIALMGWASIGHLSAQVLIKDFIEGPNTYHDMSSITSIRDTIVYMSQDGDLWKTNGTCDGTVLVKDYNYGQPSRFTPMGNKVFFRANDPNTGIELWATSGTEASTYLVKDIRPGANNSNPDHFCLYHGILYFAASTNSAGDELWRSDGTTAGTTQVIDLRPGVAGSEPSSLIVFKDTLFFIANTSIGPALWKSDGTAAGTVLVKDFNPFSTGGDAYSLRVAGNHLFMKVNDNANGLELWASDGSSAGTYMVKDINPGSLSSLSTFLDLYPLGNTVFFAATDGVNGEELWRSNGTAGGTYMVKDIYTGNLNSGIKEMTHLNDVVYFNARSIGLGDELWRSDGTEMGTFLVRDINTAASASSSPQHLTRMSDGFYFSAIDGVHGYELWWSDGTYDNTIMVKDIRPGMSGSGPNGMARVYDEVVFIAETDVSGEELWSTGPTPSGPPVDARIDSIVPQNCHGQKIGAIYITVTAGDCPVVFQWTGLFNQKYYTEDLTNLWAGTYTLTVTDAKGTTKVLVCEVPEPATLNSHSVSSTPPDCLGNLGSLTIEAQGGTPPYSYLWDNGVEVPAQSNIPLPGEGFLVTVTDAHGCTHVGNYGTYAEIPYVPYFLVNHPISCYNDLAYIFTPEGTKNSGTDQISTTLYHWEAGPGGQIVSDPNQEEIIVRGEATYYVTITASSSSCTATDSVAVTGDFLPPYADAGPDVQMTCSTNEVKLNGTASANGHPHSAILTQWEAFDGGNIVSSPFDVAPVVNRPGTYVMTVQNRYNGCAASDTVVVSAQFEGPAVSVTGDPSFCGSGEVDLLAAIGAGAAVFDGWYTSGGLYSTDLHLQMPESEGWTYVVAKASNNNGCVTEVRVDLLRNNQPSFVALSADSLGCGGVPIKVAYDYPYENLEWVWTGPAGYYYGGKDAYAYTPGFYYLSLTAGNCEILDTIEVVGTPSIQLRQYELFPPTCPGQNDGQIVLYEISGAWTYNVIWSNETAGTWNSGLAPGHYWAGISGGADIDGECYIQKDFYVPYPDSIEIALAATPDTNGTGTGAISSTVTGAAPPPYLFHWSNGASTASISGLTPGIYTVTVTYNLNYYCTATAFAVVLSGGCALDLDETMHQDNVCEGQMMGQIAVSVSNGTPPYEYAWSSGASSANLANLASGTYSLTVTDEAGCSVELVTEILTSDTLAPVLQLATLTRSLDATGHLTLTALEFDAGSADNCAIVSFTASPLEFGCDDLGLRIVEVTATDAAGNVAIGQTTLLLQDNIPPQLNCPENIVTGSCTNIVYYNLPEVAYDACVPFDPGQLTQLGGLPSGAEFPVGITEQLFRYAKPNGLSDSCSFTVTVAPEPSAIEVQSAGALCYGVCTGAASVIVRGGAPPFVYQWNTGQAGATITDLCGGEYVVTIYDEYDCSWTDTALVPVPAELLIAVSWVTHDHNSMGMGAIGINYTGGVPPYQFAWYLDTLLVGNAAVLEGLYEGNYYCVMTDSNGCTVTSEMITVNNFVGTAEPAWAGGFLLTPNPASGEVQLQWMAKRNEMPLIRVFDQLGKPADGVSMRDGNPGNIVLDVSNAAPGMYWVQLATSDGRVSRKLVVVH